ncbi:MAG: membrane dipeptidase [Eubacterium sp.]|nr:membrane dipeptidase [Eubacterium sp.]
MDYFDCHADTLTEIPASETLMKNSCCVDLTRVRRFAGRYTQIFALWKDKEELARTGMPTEEVFWQMYQAAMRLLLEQAAYVKWCQDVEDMRQAHAQGKAAVFLAVEDLSVMGELVDQLQRLGIRFAMLTWNYENTYGCGAVSDQSKGLTKEGCALVRRLVRQQVILDLSHLSDQGVEEVFQLTDRPVIASHSNVREICGHPRNLKKEHIRELIRRKGLLGMNFYREFVGAQPDIGHLLRHIDAVLELGGEDILALGGDLDGCGNELVYGIEGVQSIPFLRSELERAGMGNDVSEKMFWKNAARFFDENLE